MKLRYVALAVIAIFATERVAEAAFQSGQILLKAWPTTGRLAIDNGGPTFTVLPESAGTVTLNGATPVTVADTAVDAGSVIIFTLKSVNSGTVGAYPAVQTITPGTGFTVAGTAGDTGVYQFVILG